MKKLFAMILLCSTMLFALGQISTLPTNEKKLLSQVLDRLNIPQNISVKTKKTIYDKMSSYLINDWSTHWITNVSVASSKVGNSKTQVVDLMIYNNNRIVNITFIYFSTQKQLFTSTKEYLKGKSSDVMKNYNKLQKDEKYVKGSEADNYAYFQEKGYISYIGYHIESPVGMIVYESNNILDIEELKE